MKRWVLMALMFCASQANGQATLRVRAESDARTPLAGALIALVDPENRVITEVLTTAEGFASLQAAPGSYRVRVRRIGFRPFYSAPTTIPRPDILILRVESPRVVLNELVVSASAQCGRINPDAATLASLWEEISKALRSSQLTVGDLKEIARVQTFVREIGLNGEVTSSDSTNRSVANRRPFAAVDPGSFVKLGYVRGDEQKGWDFFGPDETVLLSNDFASTHCFRAIRQRTRRGQIGVAFEPAPRRRLADIRGVIWLDERSSELREVEFNYVNVGVLSDFQPRGYTRFRRMPSGAWLVSDWQLQLPRLARGVAARDETRIVGTIQNGGRVVFTEEIAPSAQQVRLTGIVFDSLFMSPLKQAIVSAGGKTVKTDEAGRFDLGKITGGRILVTFTHRIVSSLGLVAYEQPVELRGDTAIVLATPSRQTVWTRVCRAQPEGSDAAEKGILHGVVRNETGEPLAGARVSIRLDESGQAPVKAQASTQSLVEITSDRNGHYAVCGFRRLASGTLSATRNSVVSEKKAFEFGGGLILRKDLTLGEASSSTETTRDIVVSITDAAGDVVADALIQIDGTTSSARTSEEGRALLRTSSTHFVVTVRRLGYADQSLEVQLGEARRQLLKIVLDIPPGRS